MKSIWILCAILVAAHMPAIADDALNELLKKYEAKSESKAEPSIGGSREPASSTKAKPMKVKRKKAAPPEPVAPPATAPAPAVVKESVEEEEADPALFGDWGGAKSKMKEAGIEIALGYKATTMSVMSGGLKRGTHYFGNVDLTTDLDLEKLAGAKGLTLSLYGLGNHGGTPSEFVGNEAGVDNIEAPSTFKLYEAYLKQQVDDRFILLLGLRDYNADYFSTESSKAFLNPSFGIGTIMAQTGANGPSIFPTTALALNVKYESPSSFYFQAGVFDAQAGDPDNPYGTQITHNHDAGQLLVSELGWAKEEDGVPCKLALGGWKYTVADVAVDTNKSDAQNWGFYLLLDKKLFKGVNGFVRHGIAEKTVNTSEMGTDIGLTFKGLFPSRENDVLGLGATRVQFTDDYKMANGLNKDDETVIELLYRLELPHGIIIQPDLQYVINPGGTDTVDNVWVGATRVEINF